MRPIIQGALEKSRQEIRFFKDSTYEDKSTIYLFKKIMSKCNSSSFH